MLKVNKFLSYDYFKSKGLTKLFIINFKMINLPKFVRLLCYSYLDVTEVFRKISKLSREERLNIVNSLQYDYNFFPLHLRPYEHEGLVDYACLAKTMDYKKFRLTYTNPMNQRMVFREA